jgi:pseudoazurin
MRRVQDMLSPDMKAPVSRRLALTGAAAAIAMPNLALASPVEVKMLNKGTDGEEMVFEPALVRIPVGGSVRFVPTDRTHNAASIRTILPEGAIPFAGKIDEEITVQFGVAGVHGIQCSPHYAMGMVMIVVAGNAVNLEAARAVRISGLAGSRIRKLLSQL